MRTSSKVPWKAPRRVPVEVIIAPNPARWMLSKRGVKAPTVDDRLEVAVQVEAPRRPVVGRGGVVPSVVDDGRRAGERVVQARRRVLEVGGDDVAARC